MSKRAINASGGGFFLNTGENGILRGASLRSGTDAATATIRSINGSGGIIAVLGADPNLTDHVDGDIPYEQALHVTITGTAPVLLIYV